jgi:hypothetical protein
MDRRTAGAYLGMSPRSAERLLLSQGACPLRLGLRLRRWRKADIDDLLLRIPEVRLRASPSGDAELVEAGLAAVARRSGRRTR